MPKATFKIWRGDSRGGELYDYATECTEGMVVLDAVHDIQRVQEFRKCIECFLCQDVCHVLRDHQMHDQFIGPRFLIHVAALEMHPLDTEDRIEELRNTQGIGYCNITKCCTKVCPESIQITDNGIIPLKERVVDDFYDPFGWVWRWLKKKADRKNVEALKR